MLGSEEERRNQGMSDPDPEPEKEKKYRTIDHEVVHKFAFSSDLWHQLVEDIKAGKNPVEIWDANSHIFLELHHLE